jgi:hypothetical protein
MSVGFVERHSRRWFLNVAGGSVALAHWLRNAIARADGQGPPKRLVVIHRPNGTIQSNWITSANQRGPILEPFAPVWSYVVALKGMNVRPGNNGGAGVDPHGRSMQTIMTGAHLRSDIPQGSDDGRWNTAESLDQTWARESPVLKGTPVPSLQLGANTHGEPQNRTMSYAGPAQPLYPTVNPSDVFRRVFGSTINTPPSAQAKLKSRRESVLKFVKEDLKRVRDQFPASARPTLDAHEGAVRELEMKLGGAPNAPTCAKPADPSNLPVGQRDENSLTRVAQAHFDLLKATFICDQSRVATFMWGPLAYEGNFDSLKAYNHHGIQHANPQRADLITAIDTWFSQKTVPFIQMLVDTPDPAGGKLIDNTLVWYINENGHCFSHGLDDMPFLLIGGDGVRLASRGRIAQVPGTTSNDVWLSMAPVFGMNLTSLPTQFTGPIRGLFT